MIAIMQPYFLPKLSYWQLINKAETFVIYDDVQYIKGGWINRNRVLVNNLIKIITIPVKNDNLNKLINERYLADNWDFKKKKILSLIRESYKKSINFEIIYPLLINIFNFKNKNLSKFVTNSIVEISNFLEINTNIVNSSSLNICKKFKKENKLFEICKIFNSKEYINPIGGKKIYDKNFFKKNHINLYFLFPTNSMNNINSSSFDLSIIDTLMNVEKKVIQKELNSFQLI